MNNDHKTTILGSLLGATFWATIDLGRLMAGEPSEIAKLISGIIVAALGWYTNK